MNEDTMLYILQEGMEIKSAVEFIGLFESHYHPERLSMKEKRKRLRREKIFRRQQMIEMMMREREHRQTYKDIGKMFGYSADWTGVLIRSFKAHQGLFREARNERP